MAQTRARYNTNGRQARAVKTAAAAYAVQILKGAAQPAPRKKKKRKKRSSAGQVDNQPSSVPQPTKQVK